MLPVLLTDTVSPDLARATHYALMWGLEGVALRTVGRASERVPFVNEAALRHRLDEAELPVAVLDPGLLEGALASRAAWLNDADALADTLAFARRLGGAMPLVATGALATDLEGYDPERVAEALRPAAEAARRAGTRLAVRNEAGTAVATGRDLAQLLAALDHPGAGADWRPADALAHGETPEAGRDALLAAPGGPAAVTLPDAFVTEHTASLGQLLRPLAAAGWEGPLVLHVHSRPAAPAGLAAATALVRAIREARRPA